MRTILYTTILFATLLVSHLSCKKESSCDACQDQVDPAPAENRPPVANAGPDQGITLSTNGALLDGSRSTDPDNNIAGYSWTWISGPSSFVLGDELAVQTQVTNLVEGIYQFELTVTDSAGLSSVDTMQLQVLKFSPACTHCRIVFVSDRDGNQEIYTCSQDGTDIRRLTYEEGADFDPVWSPDGSRIAFVSDRSGSPELYIMNADGSGVERRTFDVSYVEYPTWSPDGTKIAYSAVSDGSTNIWVIDAAGGQPNVMFAGPGWDSQPAWSPDGNSIALSSDWAFYDFVYDIYTVNTDGSGFTLVSGPLFGNYNYLCPGWSPDGTKLSVSVLQELGNDEYVCKVGILKSDGSKLDLLKSDAVRWNRISWSTDGASVIYTSRSSNSTHDISWMMADGSLSAVLIPNAWSADWQH